MNWERLAAKVEDVLYALLVVTYVLLLMAIMLAYTAGPLGIGS